MNEQLLKMALLAEQPWISIRIVPSKLGASSVFGGEFVVFQYDRHDPLVYLEYPHIGLFLDGDEYVPNFDGTVAELRKVALSGGQSRSMLAGIANEYDRPEDRDAPVELAEEHLQFRS